MQAGVVAVQVIAILLALFGRRRRRSSPSSPALGLSACWLMHHIADPLAIALQG